MTATTLSSPASISSTGSLVKSSKVSCQVLQVGADGLLAVDWAVVIGCALYRPVVDVVRQVPGPGIQVAAVEGLSRIADGLYVLLRHRHAVSRAGILLSMQSGTPHAAEPDASLRVKAGVRTP